MVTAESLPLTILRLMPNPQPPAPATRTLLLRLIARLQRVAVRRPPAAPAAIRRILLIKPDHLGDMLLATPALTRLRQHYPHAQITLLTGAWAAPIVATNRQLDTLHPLPFPGFVRAAGNVPAWQPYTLLLRTALLLRSHAYDAALLLRDDHWWGAALALLAGIPVRVGMAAPAMHDLLTLAVAWNPTQHVTAQALALVESLVRGAPATPATGWQPDLPPLDYTPPAPDAAWAAAYLSQHSITPTTALYIIHPGTGGNSKHWLPERWAAVGTQLAQLPHARVLLTGGANEAELVAQIAAHMHPAPLTLAGATSIGQLAALLARAHMVLGVDSGPLHLAVSQGTPTLHLFGASDARRFGAWGDPRRHRVLQAELWCRPCGVFAACPRQLAPPECMQQISVAQVLAAVQELGQAVSGG